MRNSVSCTRSQHRPAVPVSRGSGTIQRREFRCGAPGEGQAAFLAGRHPLLLLPRHTPETPGQAAHVSKFSPLLNGALRR
jgi:hypothetical protein